MVRELLILFDDMMDNFEFGQAMNRISERCRRIYVGTITIVSRSIYLSFLYITFDQKMFAFLCVELHNPQN